MKDFLLRILFNLVIIKEGQAYFKHAATLEDSQGTFCIDVGPKEGINELPSQPKLALILKVAYPNFSVAEAGTATIGADDLLHGRHNITYKYFISNMAHALRVQLDGSPQKFITPDESGWYSVSSFREIDVLTQGNVKLRSCSGGGLVKELKFQKDSREFGDDSEESFFLREFETTEKYLFDNFPKETLNGKSVYNPMATTTSKTTAANIGVGAVERETTLQISPHFHNISTEASLPQPPAGTDEELDEEQKRQQNISSLFEIGSDETELEKKLNNSSSPTTESPLIKNLRANPRNDESSLPNSFIYNDTYSETGRTENVMSVNESHNYTIAIALLLSLIGLVIVAIIVSVIFHRKNKKLVLAKPRPSNKLHKLYDSTNVCGETSVMLEKLESTLESEC